ncbi:flagellar brake protein [Helicovermis profundi]|uniref:Flagellar brake protein n=1 Tax=Helicovermis profundi TaxID=3065157 RepID=A0AAU9EB78_9FIRM|nr:hypothetical protein HLPR_23980 [Clostridia bacterium S502]
MKNNLSKIVKPGDSAMIIVENNGEFIELKTIIEGINSKEKILVNSPLYKCNYYPIRENDIIRLNIHKDGIGIIDFNARVVKRVKTNNFNNIVLVKENRHEILQRRNYYRLEIMREVKFNRPDIVKGTTKDISAGGMKCITLGELFIDEIIEVNIDINNNILKVKGQVLSVKNVKNSKLRYESRISFLDVDENDRSKIVSYIFSVQRKRKRSGIL